MWLFAYYNAVLHRSGCYCSSSLFSVMCYVAQCAVLFQNTDKVALNADLSGRYIGRIRSAHTFYCIAAVRFSGRPRIEIQTEEPSGVASLYAHFILISCKV